MDLTKEQVTKYLDSGGATCPVCGSSDIFGEQFEVESGEAVQPISCHACGASWEDIYTLTDVSNAKQ